MNFNIFKATFEFFIANPSDFFILPAARFRFSSYKERYHSMKTSPEPRHSQLSRRKKLEVMAAKRKCANAEKVYFDHRTTAAYGEILRRIFCNSNRK
jgi:hypothetical protein